MAKNLKYLNSNISLEQCRNQEILEEIKKCSICRCVLSYNENSNSNNTARIDYLENVSPNGSDVILIPRVICRKCDNMNRYKKLIEKYKDLSNK